MKENLKGVSFFKKTNSWRSQIWIDNSNRHLGYYSTKEQAKEVYQIAKKNIYNYDGDAKKFRELIKYFPK
jgi:hypothetical protein